MPFPILGWVAVAAGTAVAGYIGKKLLEEDTSSSSSSSYSSEEEARKQRNILIREEAKKVMDETIKSFKLKYDKDVYFVYKGEKISSFLHKKVYSIRENMDSIKLEVKDVSLEEIIYKKNILEEENKKLLELKKNIQGIKI